MDRLLQSSANPKKLATTVVGFLTALIPVLVILFSAIGLNIGTAEISEVIAQIGIVISSALIAFGLGRKLYFTIKALFVK